MTAKKEKNVSQVAAGNLVSRNWLCSSGKVAFITRVNNQDVGEALAISYYNEWLHAVVVVSYNNEL